jgi:hypothetical protein
MSPWKRPARLPTANTMDLRNTMGGESRPTILSLEKVFMEKGMEESHIRLHRPITTTRRLGRITHAMRRGKDKAIKTVCNFMTFGV